MRFPSLSLKDAYLLRSLYASNFKRLSFPFKLSYAVTYRCNLRCSMCSMWKKASAEGELSAQEAEDFFSSSNGFSWIAITGGEPFLRPDLPEIADAALRHCRRLGVIFFATNGQLQEDTLRTVEHIRARAGRTRVVVSVSIDGPPGLHDRIRGKEGAWEKAVETFKSLKKSGSSRAQISFTLSSANIGRFADTFRALKESYPPLVPGDITVSVFQRADYYGNQDMPGLNLREAKEGIAEIQRFGRGNFSLGDILRRRYLSLYGRYLDTGKCPLQCQALSSTCFMDPRGDLFPCLVYDKKLVNVRDMEAGLGELWKSSYAKGLSRECSHHGCPGCWNPCDAYNTMIGSLFRRKPA